VASGPSSGVKTNGINKGDGSCQESAAHEPLKKTSPNYEA
jgi:hypothetical protein